MMPLNYIAFVQPAPDSSAPIVQKLADEGFSYVLLSPGKDLPARLTESQPGGVLLSGSLGKAEIEKIIAHVKELFSHVPIFLVYDEGGGENAERPSLPTADGVCYASMPSADLALLLRGAIRAGFAIHELAASNRKLNEISITDALTGLFNRSYLLDRLNLEFKRASRNREAMSCLMIDLDHFKQINDTYGHRFGDIILEAVSKRLNGLIRETDIFGRYGGEEFLIILPNTNMDGAVNLAEKLRAGLEGEKITHEFFSLLVTASFGVATNEHTDVITADHLLQLSDRALYKAKETGRNRVCVAEERETEREMVPPGQTGHRYQQRSHIDVVSVKPEANPHIQELIRSKEFDTALHYSERSFLESFKIRPPDLLVIECKSLQGEVEGMFDAFALCRRVKKQIQELFIPLVMLLPRPDDPLREKALAAGADDVIMYPMQGKEFLIRLQSMLHLKALHDRWRTTYRDLTMARTRLIKVERLTALGEMAGGVAHDFNNILSAILGRSQILRRNMKDPDILKNLDIIEKAANDGAATIRRIQDFSRSTTDRAYENVDMAQVVQDCIQMTRTRWKDQAESQGINYEFRTNFTEPLCVKGCPTELREVITNLIMNALDAMPHGGEMRFDGQVNSGQVLLTIQDTGCGMDEEVLKRIFDPFFSTKKGEGTGLGLSVAYGIIVRHNGRIECSSRKGEGAVFRVHLPYERLEILPQAAPVRDKAAIETLRTLSILVVDDEEQIREIFRDLLQPEGHEVFLADTGQAALAVLEREKKIDLLFTDLSMPEMSGWEVARQFRKRSPDTVIVLTSGWGKDFNQKQLAKHGVNHVLPKPVPFETLQRLVRQVALGQPIHIPG